MQDADRKLLWAGVGVGATIAVEILFSFVNREWLDSAAFWTAAFTGLLTLSTALLWFVTERTLRHARSDYVASHRPHVRVRRIDHVVMTVGQPIAAQIEAANIGPTEARIRQIGIDLFFRSPANPAGAQFGASPTDVNVEPIPPGKSGSVSVRSSQPITQAQIQTFQAGQVELCALGIINYEDRNGAGRSTSFFRIYRAAGARFFPAPDDPWQGDREFED